MFETHLDVIPRRKELIDFVISVLDMRIADINAEFLGVSRLRLMENAGKGLAEAAIHNLTGRNRVLVFAGTGGNGGDAIVAARHLAGDAEIFVIVAGSEFRSEIAEMNWRSLEKMRLTVRRMMIERPQEELSDDLLKAKGLLIIDGLLGTGIGSGIIREPIAGCIDFINKAKEDHNAFVISADVPSGIDPQTGIRANKVVQADLTVAFHDEKPGLTGNVKITKIGIPPEAEIIAGPGDLIPVQSHKLLGKKGEHGRVLIVAGSIEYSGAPALAGMGAIAGGADLVRIITSESVSTAVRSFSPDLIVSSYPSDFFSEDAIDIVEENISKTDCVLVGPGLGSSSDVIEGVRALIDIVRREQIPIILDAEALRALVAMPLPSESMITPHDGEFRLLTEVTLPRSEDSFIDRVRMIREEALNRKCVILSKGPWDIICDGKKWKARLEPRVPEMAHGGTGDVLAGLVSAFTSVIQTEDRLWRAGVASTYINASAGKIAVESSSGLNCTTLIQHIPKAIQNARSLF